MNELTPWFDGDVKPKWIGVYQRDYWAPFSWWDGESWRSGAACQDDAAKYKNGFCSDSQSSRWRGLAKKP